MFATMFTVIAVLLFIALENNDALPSKSCKVPNGNGGTCTLLNTCKPLLDISKKKQKTDLEDRFFRQSVAVCGSRGAKLKVCCPPPSEWSLMTVNPVLFSETPITATNVKPVGTVPKPTDDAENRIFGTSGSLSNTSDISFTAWLTNWNDAEDGCGEDASSSHRIVGGNATDIDEFPWLVLLEYGADDFRCGGTLISKSHVLTAAHCLYTTPERVRLSEYNLTTFPTDIVETNGGGIDTITVEIVDVQWAVRHPEHQVQTSINDIGLIKLASPVKMTDFIKPICLPTINYRAGFTDKSNFTVAGWGGDNEFVRSEVKRSVVVPYVSYEQCQENYLLTKISREQHLCAGGQRGKDSCRGDSGGPLMFEDKTTYVIVGIVSSGASKCGTEGVPAIYTYVYEYVDWINRMMNSNAIIPKT